MTQKENLLNFNGSNDEVELQKMFDDLAPSFLYGGFLKVRDDYKILIRTVEFYFHSEKIDGIHDPIVYHRDVRRYDGAVLRKVPYFPLMTLHAHNSGFDITFENEKREYRASALIRAYEVKDRDGNYLKWGKSKEGEYMFTPSKVYCFNSQSTYLYSLLNGFPLGENNDIHWIDDPREHSSVLEGEPRKNVYKSGSEWKYDKTDVKCERKWSFTRNEIV